MLLTNIGPRGYHKAIAAVSSTFTPLFDRSALVRRLLIDNPSANDTWVVSVNGREIWRFLINTTGNQQLLGGPATAFPKTSDLFAFFNVAFDQMLYLPVQNGATLTVASVGGATANIIISYEEHSIGDVTDTMLNSSNSNHFIMPIYGYRNANVTAAGEVAFDTQVGPAWLPNLFIDNEVPPNMNIAVLGLFLEGLGVNTYNGAADHRSVTDHLALTRNGQRMFTRDALDGIPLIGTPAATGSANTVYGAVQDPFPAFQLIEYINWTSFEQPLMLRPGDLLQWRLGVTGDVTGGASYAGAIAMMLVDFRMGA